MKLLKFQQGGEMPQQGGAPAQGGPEEQIMAMAQQIIQQVGPEGAAMLAEVIMQMLQQGGGQQAPAPQGEPVYAKKGGKLTLVKRK